MQRRNFLIGAAGTAIGGSALVGSGAFSSVEAERDVSVQVADDMNAYLGLQAEKEEFLTDDSDDGQLELDLGDPDNEDNDTGEGFNQEAITKVEGVFSISNQGTQTVGVGFNDDPDGPIYNRNVTDEIEPIDGVTLKLQGETENFDPGGSGVSGALLESGGDPVLVDVEIDTLNTDLEDGDSGEVVIGGYQEGGI